MEDSPESVLPVLEFLQRVFDRIDSNNRAVIKDPIQINKWAAIPRIESNFTVLDYVYEGVWKNHSEQPLRRWTLTLSDSKALICLACLTALIAFAQTRSWVLIRYVVYQQTKSPALPGDLNADYRQHLSQGKAIAETIPSIKIFAKSLWHKATQHETDCPVTSPWFGMLALLNISTFIFLGVLAPWSLSDGSLKSPVVRSKVTDACRTSHQYEAVLDQYRSLSMVDAIFQQCSNQLNGSCNEQFYLRKPQVRKDRIKKCPFPFNICHNNTMPIEMTHWNIGAHEVGVNTPTEVTMNHRLTCAPINLDYLTYFVQDNSSSTEVKEAFVTVQDLQDLQAGTNLSEAFYMDLRTLNGPNGVSDEKSGRQMFEANIPPDFTVLPRWRADQRNLSFDPQLRRSDAMPFLVIYRAGRTKNYIPVDDPFFSAHDNWKHDDESFLPDREATALGCIEQFQFCAASPNNCTDWANSSTTNNHLATGPNQFWRDWSAWPEILTTFSVWPWLFSVRSYLAVRAFNGRMIPLTTIDVLDKSHQSQERWVSEVETWFTKGILTAILQMRYGVRFPLDGLSELMDQNWRKKHSLCGSILFRDGRYTNINWVGLWIAVAMLLTICLTSYTVGMVHSTAIKLGNTRAAIISASRTLKRSVTNFAQRAWSGTRKFSTRLRNRSIEVWRSYSFVKLTRSIERRDPSSSRSRTGAGPTARLHQSVLDDIQNNETYSL